MESVASMYALLRSKSPLAEYFQANLSFKLPVKGIGVALMSLRT